MKVEDLVEQIIDYRGKTPPKVSSGIPLITAKVIKGGRILPTREFITEDVYTAWMRRGFPQQWDLLVTTEAPLGEIALLRTAERIALAQRVILLRGNGKLIDQRYLAYVFESPLVQDQLRARATGTTVQGIKQSELRQVDIPVLPLEAQQKIAAVLAAYDELIENNLRRIEILEEMAQAVYREWFVNFHYPGHENVPLVDSPLGPIPEGWEVVHLGDMAVFKSGGSTTKKSYVEEGFLAFSASGPDGLLPNYEVEGEGVVISAVGANCGRTWLAQGRWSAIANTIRFVPQDSVPASYLFLATRHNPWPKRGSAQPFVSINDCRAQSVKRPPSQLLLRFATIIDPMYRLVLLLTRQNANLRTTRDLLLPKLVSGEIDVSDLDIDTEWLVA